MRFPARRRRTSLTLAQTGDAVEDVAGLAFAAVRAQQVDAPVAAADALLALVVICKGGRTSASGGARSRKGGSSGRTETPRAVFVEVVSPATVDGVPLADVGAHGVDAGLASLARARLTDAFVNVCKAKEKKKKRK